MDVPGVPYLPVFLSDLHAAHSRHTAIPPGQEELFDLERARALAPTLGTRPLPGPKHTKSRPFAKCEISRKTGAALLRNLCGSDTCFDLTI